MYIGQNSISKIYFYFYLPVVKNVLSDIYFQKKLKQRTALIGYAADSLHQLWWHAGGLVTDWLYYKTEYIWVASAIHFYQ